MDTLLLSVRPNRRLLPKLFDEVDDTTRSAPDARPAMVTTARLRRAEEVRMGRGGSSFIFPREFAVFAVDSMDATCDMVWYQ